MTDRHAGYIVTLSHDVRDDGAEPIIAALRMVKGVLSVQPVLSDEWQQHLANERAYDRVRAAVLDLLEKLR